MALNEFLIILISVIVTGMVPWGYVMHGRLTAIEVAVKETSQLRVQISEMSQSVHNNELRLVRMENNANGRS